MATLPAETLSIAGSVNSDNVKFWQRTTIALCMVTALLIGLLWWLLRIAGKTPTFHRPVNNEKNAWRNLKLHAHTGSDTQLRQAIMVWLQTLHPQQVLPLDFYIARKYPGASAHINRFDQSLYGQHPQQHVEAGRPARQTLLSALKTLRREWQVNRRHATTADRLYPLWSAPTTTKPQPRDQSILNGP